MLKMDFSNVTNGILRYIDIWAQKLIDLPVDTITNKRNKQSRTIKQIMGHLIDSAANNHQRMVRLQYNDKLDFPDYQQDNDLWIALQDYQNADWNISIQLWKYYNLHMIQVIKSVDHTKLENSWQNFEGVTVTLRQMIDGYLGHIELHLNEIQELIDQ
ncbi:DinB family protein [Bacteroides thetaiotaomicron]|uniref:DinB family protein n=1 Tax=Bacteroides thetaiotaomicron TaxID=818 RepID=UPI001F954E6B|nr:DinB family protein [Bacteroides thetaiotaomicron]MCE8488693.1 DinB family protein [Bacteroides thetaiotaomicron]